MSSSYAHPSIFLGAAMEKKSKSRTLEKKNAVFCPREILIGRTADLVETKKISIVFRMCIIFYKYTQEKQFNLERTSSNPYSQLQLFTHRQSCRWKDRGNINTHRQKSEKQVNKPFQYHISNLFKSKWSTNLLSIISNLFKSIGQQTFLVSYIKFI